jgi:hypothetical protein
MLLPTARQSFAVGQAIATKNPTPVGKVSVFHVAPPSLVATTVGTGVKVPD